MEKPVLGARAGHYGLHFVPVFLGRRGSTLKRTKPFMSLAQATTHKILTQKMISVKVPITIGSSGNPPWPWLLNLPKYFCGDWNGKPGPQGHAHLIFCNPETCNDIQLRATTRHDQLPRFYFFLLAFSRMMRPSSRPVCPFTDVFSWARRMR